MNNSRDTSGWRVPASTFARNTFNPIRNIVQNLKITPHPDKQMIALSIGDPTLYGNLKPAPEVVEAVVVSLRSNKNNGYHSSMGQQAAREAVAEYMTVPGAVVDPEDVIICSGCSCALDLSLSAICSAGQTLLTPRPGFPLYKTLTEGFGVINKSYDVLPEKNWEIDLVHLESLIDETTAAIVINNPSNPCGSVYSKRHLQEIAALAVKYKVPIIADEIYDNFVFEGEEYHPIASVNPNLPVLACGGLTKRFLVPGWRTGWVAIHNRGGALTEVAAGLRALSQRIIGSNTIVQGALPTILRATPTAFFTDTLAQVQANAKLCFQEINQIPGLKPIKPQGAMYMMVHIEMRLFPEFNNDLEFVERMVAEQSVFCLPGKCFNIEDFIRIVLTVPEDKMIEACNRIREFCMEHFCTKTATETAIKKARRGSIAVAETIPEIDETTINDATEALHLNGNREDQVLLNGTPNQHANGTSGACSNGSNCTSGDAGTESVGHVNCSKNKCIITADKLVDEMECD